MNVMVKKMRQVQEMKGTVVVMKVTITVMTTTMTGATKMMMMKTTTTTGPRLCSLTSPWQRQ